MVVTRSGDWLRRDTTAFRHSPTSISYSNVASGVSVWADRDQAGRPEHLHVSRHSDRTYARVRTGRRDSLLGETCEVWLYQREPHAVDCVTEDGVQLWSRSFYTGGELSGGTRAISLVRRRVDASEVRPPRVMFAWETWRRGIANASGPPNDEVTLVSPDGQQAMIRRRAGWRYRDGADLVLRQGERHIELTHEASGLYLHYRAYPDGARTLIVRRSRDGDGWRFPPVNQNRTETVLGERCTWFSLSPPLDVHQMECRAHDGIALMVRRTDFLSPDVLELRATRVRRGGVSEADIRPPAEVFAWGL
jgi:hypothetical protein